MNYLKISIVTPNYNNALYLEETILSVLNQNYPNLEYIIIDGGSTDGSIEIIKKYEQYLTFWISEPDNGVYDAINKGFNKSTGEVMAWINSDDIYHSGSFSIVNEIFNNFDQIQWLQGIPTTIDKFGRTINISKFKNWSKVNFVLNDFKWIQQESTFWRRKLWNESGSSLNTKFKLAADLELWSRFFEHADLYSTNFLLGAFRKSSNNQLSSMYYNDYITESQKILENYNFKFKEKYPKEFKKLKQYLQIKILNFSIFNYTKNLVINIYLTKYLHNKFNFKRLCYDTNCQKFILK